MSILTPRPARPSVSPPLQNGDRLTRIEFERRFDATPNLKNAELIEGVVYMPPPVSHEYHSSAHAQLITLFGTYSAASSGTTFGDNASLRLDLDNMPQPDAFLMILPEHGGQAQIDKDGYVEGAPELIGEIAATTASHDLHVKMNVYRRSGVREYIVWRTLDGEIDYFILRDGRFERHASDERGIWRSETFPGLWLAREPLLAGDLAGALRVLQQGLATTEHSTFLTALQEKHQKH